MQLAKCTHISINSIYIKTHAIIYKRQRKINPFPKISNFPPPFQPSKSKLLQIKSPLITQPTTTMPVEKLQVWKQMNHCPWQCSISQNGEESTLKAFHPETHPLERVFSCSRPTRQTHTQTIKSVK